jgi:hypothetical protein
VFVCVCVGGWRWDRGGEGVSRVCLHTCGDGGDGAYLMEGSKCEFACVGVREGG